MINHQAIYNTHPEVVSIDETLGAFDKDGNSVVLDQDKVDEETAKIEAETDAQRYARARQANYPSIGDQLAKIYDDGIDKWKTEMVDPVKAKWPKDNSGPVE